MISEEELELRKELGLMKIRNPGETLVGNYGRAKKKVMRYGPDYKRAPPEIKPKKPRSLKRTDLWKERRNMILVIEELVECYKSKLIVTKKSIYDLLRGQMRRDSIKYALGKLNEKGYITYQTELSPSKAIITINDNITDL